jgi:beta-lactamase regulating signal transducer with metallopeptidase domain
MTLPAWTESWSVHVVGQTSLCLILGLWIALRFEHRPARAHVILVLALVAALAAPLASLLIKRVNYGMFASAAPATEFWLGPEDPVGISHPIRRSLELWPVALWCCTSLVWLAGILAGYIRGRRLIGRAEPVVDAHLLSAMAAAQAAVGLRAMPELRTHDEVPSPMVWAWGRVPIALIAEETSSAMEGVDWESIFIHELAHVERRDHIAGLFADIGVALLWWNPAAWLLRRELVRQSEFVCDDRVASAGRSPIEFASSLLALRREALIPRIPATSLGGRRPWLKARVSRLVQLDELPSPTFGAAWTATALLVTAFMIAFLAFAQVRTAPRPEDSFAAPIVNPTNPNQRDASGRWI